MIITPKQFQEKHSPIAAALSDEELERRINEAVEKAKPGTAIYVDVGGWDASGLPMRVNSNATRAEALAKAAGWHTSVDGRTGSLILKMPYSGPKV